PRGRWPTSSLDGPRGRDPGRTARTGRSSRRLPRILRPDPPRRAIEAGGPRRRPPPPPASRSVGSHDPREATRRPTQGPFRDALAWRDLDREARPLLLRTHPARPHSEMSLHPGMPPRPPRRSGRSPWELRSQPLRRLAPELERASGRGELVEASGWPARAQNGLPEGLVVVPRQEGHRAREGSSLERQRPQGPAPVGGERRSRGGRPPRRKRTGRGGSRHAPPRSEATNTGPSKGDAGLKERLRVPVVLLRIRFLSDVSEPLTLRALCGIARALVMD